MWKGCMKLGAVVWDGAAMLIAAVITWPYEMVAGWYRGFGDGGLAGVKVKRRRSRKRGGARSGRRAGGRKEELRRRRQRIEVINRRWRREGR